MKNFEKQLQEILNDCSKKDWDGYGADPVTKSSISLVREFVENVILKYNIPLPEVAPEPAGNVLMEWQNSEYHLLLSIENKDGKKILHCGGDFPKSGHF